MELVVVKSVAAFARHHVTVTTCLVFVETVVGMDGRVTIALKVGYINVFKYSQRFLSFGAAKLKIHQNAIKIENN